MIRGSVEEDRKAFDARFEPITTEDPFKAELEKRNSSEKLLSGQSQLSEHPDLQLAGWLAGSGRADQRSSGKHTRNNPGQRR